MSRSKNEVAGAIRKVTEKAEKKWEAGRRSAQIGLFGVLDLLRAVADELERSATKAPNSRRR